MVRKAHWTATSQTQPTPAELPGRYLILMRAYLTGMARRKVAL